MRFKALPPFLFFLMLATALFLLLNKANVIDIIASIQNTALINGRTDIGPQKPLENPPAIIKAVYVTGWSAGNGKKLNYLLNLVKKTELNALVVDAKDYSGYIGYNTKLALPKQYNAVEEKIPKLNAFIKRLHDDGIYLIGRVTVFQDPRLALARPDLALISSSTGKIWQDHKGLAWMDPASKEVWDYNIAIAKEILERGVDEVNFDYIRFASDGNLKDIKHPFWDEKKLKTHVIRDFFKYIREQLPDAKLSVDLFGLVTVNRDGLGIGQHLEYALPYFDTIAPMVYPSHYFKGFIGLAKPAEYPYEVVKYSLAVAVKRIYQYKLNLYRNLATTTPISNFQFPISKLRPFLQDFDLGADYDVAKVRAQIAAIEEIASSSPDIFDGWMLWNASNIYTNEALQPNEYAGL